MLLGINNKKIFFVRHAFIGFLAICVTYLFWLSRLDISVSTRLWRALGDTAFVFLCITLAIGPLTRLHKFFIKLLSWRREMGIWFAFLAITHFIQVREYAFNEPGIGLSMLLGFIALFFTILLLITSSNFAIKLLGGTSWKLLHLSAYIIFYLIFAHGFYFLFIRYPDINWFSSFFVGLAAVVILLQLSAFIKTVYRQRNKKKIQ